MSAADLKEQGNRFFGAHKYEEAIACYSKAIVCKCNVCWSTRPLFFIIFPSPLLDPFTGKRCDGPCSAHTL